MSAIVITSITPNQGYTNMLVTINGSGLTGITSVKFGNNDALWTFFTDSQINVISPQGYGSVSVTVRIFDKISNEFPFVYLNVPKLTNLYPINGPNNGGTLVNINGFDFTTQTHILFGDNLSLSTFFTNSHINVITPPGNGTVPVVLTNTTDQILLEFIYLVNPILNYIDPISGPSTGGTIVSLFGANFMGTTSVTFGNMDAPFFVISDKQINAISPTNVGTVAVKVRNLGGNSNALFFTFILPCLSENTKILMADGSCKEIQTIVRGDVIAGDPQLQSTYTVARLLSDQLSSENIIDIVTIQQNALGPNLPNQKLIITANHALIWQMARRPAKCFINYKNVKRKNSYAHHILPANKNGKYYVYDLQFETLGNFVANGIIVQSRSPRSNLTPLPYELYYHPELYRPDIGVDDPEYQYPLDMTTIEIKYDSLLSN